MGGVLTGVFLWMIMMIIVTLLMTMKKQLKRLKTSRKMYETWLDCYEDVHDDEFFQPRWDKEVYAYVMLDEEQRKNYF